jgi:hypothetical protein
MKFDNYVGETLDLYELADLLGSSIYGSFFKEHGRFYNFFAQDGNVALIYLEIYFASKNLGTLMSPTSGKDSELTPLRCCRSGSEKVCFGSSLRNRLFEIIELASQEGGQISEIDLWHSIFTSHSPCYLKDWALFQFTLFELVELKQIEISSRSNDQKSFRRLNEVKRGPGRPKKY